MKKLHKVPAKFVPRIVGCGLFEFGICARLLRASKYSFGLELTTFNASSRALGRFFSGIISYSGSISGTSEIVNINSISLG